MNDMKNKGRSFKDIGNKHKRITKEKFDEIINLLKEDIKESIKEKQDRISKATEISAVTIGRIRLGKHEWNKI